MSKKQIVKESGVCSEMDNSEITLAHIEALAREIAAAYNELPPMAKARALELGHALSSLRSCLLSNYLL